MNTLTVFCAVAAILRNKSFGLEAGERRSGKESKDCEREADEHYDPIVTHEEIMRENHYERIDKKFNDGKDYQAE